MSDPATFPLITAGLIWDGVTEYQNVSPLPLLRRAWLCRMYGDGTRRFSESQSAGNQHLRQDGAAQRDRDGWESIGVAIEVQSGTLPANGDGFLNYDGTMADLDNPPNQHYQLQNFRRPRRPLRPPA